MRQEHERLVDAMRAFDPARLDESAGGTGSLTWADLFTGILLHTTYHAGQIKTLKGLAKGRRRRT
jgi:hypothetical protein